MLCYNTYLTKDQVQKRQLFQNPTHHNQNTVIMSQSAFTRGSQKVRFPILLPPNIYSLITHFTSLFFHMIDCQGVRSLLAPMHSGLIYVRPFVPHSFTQGSPTALPKCQMAPTDTCCMSLGSKKKDPRNVCLLEANA
jgi:hypothetical protein